MMPPERLLHSILRDHVELLAGGDAGDVLAERLDHVVDTTHHFQPGLFDVLAVAQARAELACLRLP